MEKKHTSNTAMSIKPVWLYEDKFHQILWTCAMFSKL